jgi:AcrR family transcriptional regulator
MLALSTYLARMANPRTPRRRSYHHGDLRLTLLDVAAAIVREQGAEALTLRAVARAAGVSQTAPYRHFKDRRALVAAVAQEGFERMGAAIGRAVERGPGGLPAFRRGLSAYIRFAQQHAAEYRIMFGPELANREDLPELAASALGAFGILRDGIVRLQQSGAIGPGDAELMAITAWATLHGMAMLLLDGQTHAIGRTSDELIAAATELLITGM